MNALTVCARVFATAALLALGSTVVACRRADDRSHLAAPAFARRRLNAPYTDIVLPDVERELLEPGFVWYVDPALPFDVDAVERLPDLVEATREHLRVQIESELEALLFDE